MVIIADIVLIDYIIILKRKSDVYQKKDMKFYLSLLIWNKCEKLKKKTLFVIIRCIIPFEK